MGIKKIQHISERPWKYIKFDLRYSMPKYVKISALKIFFSILGFTQKILRSLGFYQYQIWPTSKMFEFCYCCHVFMDLPIARINLIQQMVQGLQLICAFPVQVVEWFYYRQKTTYLFPRECQTKKYSPYKSFVMMSHADGLFYF